MRRMDIVFLGGRGFHSSYGGVENAIREIALEMSLSDLRLGVCGLQGSLESDNESYPNNITLIDCPYWVYKCLGQHGMTLYCLVKSLLLMRPKVMVVFASGPNVFTPVLRLLGIKVISSLRAVDSERDKWGVVSRQILRFGEYCAWRYAHHFTVNSMEMVRRYRTCRQDVVFLPNGARVANRGSDRVVEKFGLNRNDYFLFAARLDPVKRLHLLLRAHASLPEALRLPLVVAGGHSKSERYSQSLTDQSNQAVWFLGHLEQSELDPLIRHCRAFVLPSVLEGMSNSLLAAMATGRAVLASDIAPNADVLQDNQALFLSDNVASLTAGLQRLAQDKLFASVLGLRLQQRAESNHDWAHTATILFELAQDHLLANQSYSRGAHNER